MLRNLEATRNMNAEFLILLPIDEAKKLHEVIVSGNKRLKENKTRLELDRISREIDSIGLDMILTIDKDKDVVWVKGLTPLVEIEKIGELKIGI